MPDVAPNTLIVSGTDLRAIPGIRVYGDMELFAPGNRRGDHDTVAGRPGSLPAPDLPLASYPFGVSVYVRGATRADRNAIVTGLASLLDPDGDGIVTLERRLDNGAGYDSAFATGSFDAGLAAQVLNHATARTRLQFWNLSGGWSPDGVPPFSAP